MNVPRQTRLTDRHARDACNTYTSGFDESDERRTLDLRRLTAGVVERQHEVKEVTLAKVARRVFLKVCSRHRRAAVRSHSIVAKHRLVKTTLNLYVCFEERSSEREISVEVPVLSWRARDSESMMGSGAVPPVESRDKVPSQEVSDEDPEARVYLTTKLIWFFVWKINILLCNQL